MTTVLKKMQRYLSPGKVIRRALGILLRGADPVLQLLEKRLSKTAIRRSKAPYPPVFIIGVPRSGSTLLYKTLADRFEFAFINNLSANFYRTLYMGSLLSKSLGISMPQGYSIHYGALEGLGAPNECGAFWYRWFPRGLDIYTPKGVLSSDQHEEIRREILSVSALFGAPMIFKNLFNSLRIGALVECFPEAIFIYCKRDPLQNALSLLRGRIERQGDKQAWWTLPPREVHDLMRQSYQWQVAGQVHYIERQIVRDIQSYGQERFLTINYEEFCGDVHGSLRQMESFLNRCGCHVKTQRTDIPVRFDVRKVTGLDPSDEYSVENAVRLLYQSK